MNKKIMIGCISLVLMILAISFATAVNSSNTTVNEKKETPLFGIRTRLATGEQIQNLKTRFIRGRLFFLPFQLLGNRDTLLIENRLPQKCSNTQFCGPTSETICP